MFSGEVRAHVASVRFANVRVMIGMVWLVFAALMLAQPVFSQSFRFTSVNVEGNVRIGDEAILRTAGIPRGQAVSAGQVNSALQQLQASGLFEEVEVEPRGNTLFIRVVEFPTINRIAFEGNRRIKDDALSAVIGSVERRVFNPAQVERDAGLIADAYRAEGRLAARVEPRIIRRSDNRVDVIYEILEGSTIEIERLSFVGNRAFSDRRLRRVLDTKQAGLFRALVRADTLIDERIEFDKQLLTDFYSNRGFVDFRVNSVSVELTPERDGYFVTFSVQEGQQFSFGEISVISELAEADEDVFSRAVRTRSGQTYSPVYVENDIARLERLGVREGVDFLRVEPRVSRNDRELTLDVDYVLSRGPRVFVERIDIEGNTSTLDRVVRQQFRIAEGDPFNPREIRESASRIEALGFFGAVDVNAREGSSPDQVVVDVNVEEQPTGSFTIGGSYSSSDGAGAILQYQETNFLGRGQTLQLNLSTTEDVNNTGITFVEPALLGRDLEFSFEARARETNSSFANYDSETLLFRPSLTFPVSELGRLSLNYTAERNTMSERDSATVGSVIAGEIAADETLSSSLGYTYTFDSRRNGIDQDRGVSFSFGQDFAGLGGDNQFIRTRARAVAQTRVLRDEVLLRATFEAGAMEWDGNDSRVVNRFLLNQSIMRGFDPQGIGPRQISANGADDALGGNYYVVARFDAEFPLGLPEELGITGGLFYDVGSLWGLDGSAAAGAANVVGEGSSFRHVIGVSILWDTPVGPLRFNFSEALQKESFDKVNNFEITLSTQF